MKQAHRNKVTVLREIMYITIHPNKVIYLGPIMFKNVANL